MNGRIRELAKQARKRPMGNSWCYANPDEFEQKFAELVITETTNWINENVGYVDADARADLMKHFGVNSE